MISAFANAFKIPELKKRIIFTLGIVVITRFGAAIPVPGVDANVLAEFFHTQQQSQGGSLLALMNIFSGGALEHLAIFSLTIMPYISASIIFQLLTAVVPQLQKISREEGGRQKITQYTRYVTIIIGLFQSLMFARTFQNPQSLPMFRGLPADASLVLNPGFGFEITTVITLTAGTVFMMWLGEQITERGIGNGISLLIAINILAKFPAAVGLAYQMFFPPPGVPQQYNIVHALLFIGMFFGVIAAVIVVTQAQRKVTVQYAQRMVGRKMYGGGQTYMPLRVNYSGVMPIIFAQAILMFPQTIFGFVRVEWLQRIASWLVEGHRVYLTVYSILIFFFSYFWVATVFNPIQIADDLKKHGGYVPGVRPGKPTAHFLDFTMTRITFAGAVFLTIVAVIPISLGDWLSIPYLTASFFGGTSLLIIVGVLLDTLRQIETHLLTRNYEGFLKKGRMRGRI
ncbi:MAG: preprotein translocase subunit SecY [Verrucomicrobiae bacterium]|nr:preprotein translocase subunit SecY [Verrucomicrobiae bacterium]